MTQSKHTYELCPQCWHEIKLQAEMKWQVCPNCLHYIKPCSLCDNDKADCGNCPLDKQEKPTLKFVERGNIMRPLISER